MVFERYDAWRRNPNFVFSFKNPRDWRHLFPGFGWGVGAFCVYLGLEMVGIIPKHDHGHDDHHHAPSAHGKKH